MTASTQRQGSGSSRRAVPTDPSDLAARGREILNRHAAVGLSLGVVRDGSLESFRHGSADIGSATPITADTVFRIGSITKTFTAIAVMQLWEQGRVELDAPANDYLRSYRLIPADARFRPVTVRHLLTHTAGIPEVVHLSDVLHPTWGPVGGRPAEFSVKAGDPMPSLAEYYRGGLRVVAEPGRWFAYTNHGFATLRQIVEDVTRAPLDRYFRERIFEPLGMAGTDGVRSERIASLLATGYVLRRRGAEAVPDREWICGAGGVYSTIGDVARYIAALIGGGANEHGRVLEPSTLDSMFAYHHRPDPRLPGIGLGFFRHDAGGHRVLGHDGILPGFNAGLLVAPDDGIGVAGFTNGSAGAFVWMQAELSRVLSELLGVPIEGIRTNIPQHPEIWAELCGRYRLPARISDLRGRVGLGAGVEVFVRGGMLMVRALTAVPAAYRGVPLHPDDENDPYVFRLDLSRFDMSSVRVVFAGQAGEVDAMHADLGGQPLSLLKWRRTSDREQRRGPEHDVAAFVR